MFFEQWGQFGESTVMEWSFLFSLQLSIITLRILTGYLGQSEISEFSLMVLYGVTVDDDDDDEVERGSSDFLKGAIGG